MASQPERGVRVAPPPEPADVAVVAALQIEVAPLLNRLQHVRRYSSERHTVVEGECAGKLIAVLVGGPGPVAARRSGQLLLAGHRPHWMVSAGFCGALDPAYRRGDLLLPGQIRDEAGATFHLDLRLPRAMPPGLIVHTGTLVTVDRIIRTREEKAALRERHDAGAVDMETAAVAALCAERGVRFLAVRIVCDEASEELPPEVLSVLGRTGGYRLGAAMGAIWKRPGSIKELWGLREQAAAAATRLAEVLPMILERLD